MTTKNYFDQIMDNQNKLIHNLTEYANSMSEIVGPKQEVAEKASAIFNDYVNRSMALAEAFTSEEAIKNFQEDFFNTLTANYNKNWELAMDFFKSSNAYMKEMWGSNTFNEQQEKAKKLSELYQNSLKAVYETGTANTRIVQSYFSEN
ncbi:MAG TPA: hypothetical protein PKA00_20725 [Saprospiraceae bacterium]|nr:hypothetical protein [Saprospiraceae bacterium]HMQ85347.1 hypothetical protein [Saprospiraceae bacterium]